jgi:hypothetical protein
MGQSMGVLSGQSRKRKGFKNKRVARTYQPESSFLETDQKEERKAHQFSRFAIPNVEPDLKKSFPHVADRELMEGIRADLFRGLTHFDAAFVDLQHGLVEVSLRVGKLARDGEGTGDVGTVGVEFAA